MSAPAIARPVAWPVRRDDALLAGGLLLAAELEIVLAVDDAPVVAALMALVMNGALVWRRLAPTLVALVILVCFGVQTAAGVPQNAQVVLLVTMIVALYSVGACQPLRPAVAGLLLATTLPVGLAYADTGSPSDAVFAALLVAASWAAGALVRRQQEQAATAETRARLAEAEAALRSRAAVEAERSRIARELHDIVSHNLSAVVVQAAAAEALLADDPQRAREPVRAIQVTGRRAIADMADLLALLRGGSSGDPRSPQPVLADLQELVDDARETGQAVDLHVEGSPRDLPRGLELSAYRIVQEALTNARKHAPGSVVHVVAHHGRDVLRLQITDSGATGDGHRAAAGAGHGIVGMRERIALYGGELAAGEHDGGWRVTASFPLERLT